MKTNGFQSLYQIIETPNLLKKTIDELNKILEFRSLGLHEKEARKSGNKIKIRDNEYELSDFDTKKMR